MAAMFRLVVLMIIRFAGLTALALIAGILSGWSIPLSSHMAVGGVAILGLWSLALLGWWQERLLAMTGLVIGIAVPIFGVGQMHWPLGDLQWIVQVLHGGVAIGVLVLAERLGRRLKTAGRKGALV